MFKLWSENNQENKKKISPLLPYREWDSLTLTEKQTILSHLNHKGWMKEHDEDIRHCTAYLTSAYKKQNPCPNTLRILASESISQYHQSYERIDFENRLQAAAFKDFMNIMETGQQDLVYEMLSFYAKRQTKSYDDKRFERFCNCFNDIFGQFSINIMLTNSGLIPRQENAIIEDIYKPLFQFLSSPYWKPVNKEIEDGLRAFNKHKFDHCIEHVSNAIQAFLQIRVYGKVGKGKISSLMPEARKRNLLPDNELTNQYVGIIADYIGKERASKSGAHPKIDEANESDAKLLLNIAIVVLQYWFQHT